METLQEIKNNFAQEHGYKDFESFVIGSYSPYDISKAWAIGDFQAAMEEICIRAQKAALEKASKNGVVYKLAYPNNTSKAVVEKSSITNPENLIL